MGEILLTQARLTKPAYHSSDEFYFSGGHVRVSLSVHWQEPTGN